MPSGTTRPPHALVTGAGGLGGAVAGSLAAAGWRVSATRQNPDETGTEVIRADSGDDRSLADLRLVPDASSGADSRRLCNVSGGMNERRI